MPLRQRGRRRVSDSVGNGRGGRRRIALCAAVDVCMVDVARDGAFGSDRPAMLDVQDRYGVEIQRIRGLPDDGGNFAEADVFAVRPDGRAEGIIDTCYRRTIAAGLLCGELPCPAFV